MKGAKTKSTRPKKGTSRTQQQQKEKDIGYELDTVATMTGLVRTKQGPFVLEDALRKKDWTADMIYEAIAKAQEKQVGVPKYWIL